MNDSSPPPLQPGSGFSAPGPTPLTYTHIGPSPVPPPRKRSAPRSLWGTIVAVVAAIFKFGFVILKVALPMWTLLLSLVIWGAAFGWAYGAAIVVLLLIHELGHYAVSWLSGIPAKLPIFLGPLGAVTIRSRGGTPVQSATIALAGPVAGSLAALAALLGGMDRSLHAHVLLAAANVGFAITLLNLVPIAILDGAKIVTVATRASVAVGIVLVIGTEVALYLLSGYASFFPLLIGIGGYVAYRHARSHPLSLPPQERGSRTVITLLYFLAIIGSLVGSVIALVQLSLAGVSTPGL